MLSDLKVEKRVVVFGLLSLTLVRDTKAQNYLMRLCGRSCIGKDLHVGIGHRRCGWRADARAQGDVRRTNRGRSDPGRARRVRRPGHSGRRLHRSGNRLGRRHGRTSTREGREIEIARYPWAAIGRARRSGGPRALTKLVIDPQSERILGIGLVGVNAGDMISEGVLAIEMGCTVPRHHVDHSSTPHAERNRRRRGRSLPRTGDGNLSSAPREAGGVSTMASPNVIDLSMRHDASRAALSASGKSGRRRELQAQQSAGPILSREWLCRGGSSPD